jgi:hypothetical protein
MVDVPEPQFCDNFKYPSQQSSQVGKQTTSSTVECNQDDDSNRSKHAGLHQPVNTHRKYRTDIPGGSCSGGRRDPDPVHPGNRRTGVFDLRIDHRHDRGPDAQCVQVSNKTKLAGSFQARIVLLIFLICVVILPFASAITYISFSPLGLEAEDLHIYNASGVLIGTYNTTSAGIPFDENQSYTILVVPSDQNLMGNHPELWFELFVTKLRENAIGMIVVFFIVALCIAAYRRG